MQSEILGYASKQQPANQCRHKSRRHRDEPHFQKSQEADFDAFAPNRNKPEKRGERPRDREVGPEVDADEKRVTHDLRRVGSRNGCGADQADRPDC